MASRIVASGRACRLRKALVGSLGKLIRDSNKPRRQSLVAELCRFDLATDVHGDRRSQPAAERHIEMAGAGEGYPSAFASSRPLLMAKLRIGADGSSGGRAVGSRPRERERRAALPRRGHRHGATVRTHDLADDVEPEAESLLLACACLAALEWVEELGDGVAW